ncbi:MAG: ThiF family adenylyltransferase [Nanoarchaeota archaeon]|nr:ThiF family adenylyltransferase [Nanoarchaeota archaeon]
MIALVGLGQIGSRLAAHLPGKVLVVDRDVVEENDIGPVYQKNQVGLPKADAMYALLGKHKTLVGDVTDATVLGSPSLVIDCTDNFETRFVVNAFCVKRKIPYLFSAATHDQGLCARFDPGICLSCVFPPVRDAPRCTGPIEPKVLRFLVRKILGLVKQGDRKLWVSTGHSYELPAGPCRCSIAPHAKPPGIRRLCGDTIQIKGSKFDFQVRAGGLQISKDVIRYRRGKQALTLFRDGRALVHGSMDLAAAKQWYQRITT